MYCPVRCAGAGTACCNCILRRAAFFFRLSFHCHPFSFCVISFFLLMNVRGSRQNFIPTAKHFSCLLFSTVDPDTIFSIHIIYCYIQEKIAAKLKRFGRIVKSCLELKEWITRDVCVIVSLLHQSLCLLITTIVVFFIHHDDTSSSLLST